MPSIKTQEILNLQGNRGQTRGSRMSEKLSSRDVILLYAGIAFGAIMGVLGGIISAFTYDVIKTKSYFSNYIIAIYAVFFGLLVAILVITIYLVIQTRKKTQINTATKEKKVVGRTVAIAIGIIAIVLLVSLVGAVADYTSIINGKDNNISTLTSQNNQLQAWLNANKTSYNDYLTDHHYTDSEYNSLNDSLNSLEAPRLIEIDMNASTKFVIPSGTYFEVYGYVCNIGNKTAYNCKLDVIGYTLTIHDNTTQPAKLEEYYINLGQINSEGWTYVDNNYTYSMGVPIFLSWTITPEWTSAP
jgi:hypothetical protein